MSTAETAASSKALVKRKNFSLNNYKLYAKNLFSLKSYTIRLRNLKFQGL